MVYNKLLGYSVKHTIINIKPHIQNLSYCN